MRRNGFSLISTLVAILLAGLIFSETAHAQLIFAARHIAGRINQMTQDDSNGVPAYQFATVIIDAPANKVYATAVNAAINRSKKMELKGMYTKYNPSPTQIIHQKGSNNCCVK